MSIFSTAAVCPRRAALCALVLASSLSSPLASAATAPTISGKPATSIVETRAYEFKPSTTNPAGSKLTFSITNKPWWTSFNSATGLLSGTSITCRHFQRHRHLCARRHSPQLPAGVRREGSAATRHAAGHFRQAARHGDGRQRVLFPTHGPRPQRLEALLRIWASPPGSTSTRPPADCTAPRPRRTWASTGPSASRRSTASTRGICLASRSPCPRRVLSCPPPP